MAVWSALEDERAVMRALVKLYLYFGVTGILSILVWLSALVLHIRFARSPRRTSRYWLALGVALLGLWLANVNSGQVNRIRRDQSIELKAARERAEAAAAEAEAETVQDTGSHETPQAEGDARAYRQRGKQTRDAGKSDSGRVSGAAERVEEGTAATGRMLRPRDLLRANWLDRRNLFGARCVLWLAVLLLVVDYLERFNKVFGAYFPLPIAGRIMDSLWSKPYTVHVRSAQQAALKSFLVDTVRKGETFIFFTEKDPWKESAIPRLLLPDIRPWLLKLAARLGRRRTAAERAAMRAWPGRVGFRRLTKVTCAGPGERFDSETAFESAWFGRYCFVVEGHDTGRAWIKDLAAFLSMRQSVLAHVRRTVNVVWGLGSQVPADVMKDLLFLCPETNYRLVLVGGEQPSEAAGRFDESRGSLPEPESLSGPAGEGRMWIWWDELCAVIRHRCLVPPGRLTAGRTGRVRAAWVDAGRAASARGRGAVFLARLGIVGRICAAAGAVTGRAAAGIARCVLMGGRRIAERLWRRTRGRRKKRNGWWRSGTGRR